MYTYIKKEDYIVGYTFFIYSSNYEAPASEFKKTLKKMLSALYEPCADFTNI